MSGPENVPSAEPASGRPTRMRAVALWLTIATLIAAALLGGVFIIIGDQANIAGRAWLTLLLVAAFAGTVVLDGAVSSGPNRWYLPASTILDVVVVAIGLIKIWNGPLQPSDTADGGVWGAQFGRWLGVAALVRAALIITQLYWLHFVTRAKIAATRVAGRLTVVLVWLTALVFVIPLSFPNLRPLGASGYADWWWRIAGATALVMVVCVIIPLVVRAFEPKPPRQPRGPYPPAPGYPHPGYPQGAPRYGERVQQPAPGVPTAQPGAAEPYPYPYAQQPYPQGVPPQAAPAPEQPQYPEPPAPR